MLSVKEDPSNLKFKIVKKVKDIPRQEWDNIFHNGAIENYNYYKSLDESNLPVFLLYYGIVYKVNRIVAIAPFFITEFSFDTTIQGYLKKLILSIQKRFPGFLKMKIFFFGSPLTEESEIGFSKDCDTEEILSFLLREAFNFCKKRRIGVITFYNLTNRYKRILNFLKQKKFISMEVFPIARLAIKERSFEEYIKNLGRSTRRDIRRKLRKAYGAAEIKIEERANLNGILDQAYQLYLNNLNRGGVSFEKLTPEYFSRVSENMPGITKYFIVWINNKMVAFNLCFVKDDFCIDKYIGFDYEVAHKYSLYFVTWCHNIEWCIKHGVRYYQPGTCDYDPKIRLGGKLISLYISTRLINPFINWLTVPVLKLIEPRKFDPVLKNINKYEKK